MHDPMTVAFEIKNPFSWYVSQLDGKRYYNTLFTIWHVDPEKDGTDDSCDWSGWKRKLNPKEKAIVEAIWHMETILDNRPFYPDHEAHLRFKTLKDAVYVWRRRSKWRIPVRWHFWHWRFQFLPLLYFKRWAFTRCVTCKGRFKYGETGVGGWSSEGPMWFKSENLVHTYCRDPASKPAVLSEA
jgi:hypothetical protein